MSSGYGGRGHGKDVSSPQGWSPLYLLALSCYQLHVRGGLQGTGLCLFRKISSVHDKPLWTLPFVGHCCPSIMPVLFRKERTRVLSLKSLHFYRNHTFRLLTKSQYSIPFYPSKAQNLQKDIKNNQLARFQASSLSICKLGLIWVSKHKAKFPITYTGTFLRSKRLVATHLKPLELYNTERPCDGKWVTWQ